VCNDVVRIIALTIKQLVDETLYALTDRLKKRSHQSGRDQ
jgi:hypothetical protein